MDDFSVEDDAPRLRPSKNSYLSSCKELIHIEVEEAWRTVVSFLTAPRTNENAFGRAVKLSDVEKQSSVKSAMMVRGQAMLIGPE